MTYELFDLTIEEGSLVDKGANPDAGVVFFKRNTNTIGAAKAAPEKGSPMTMDEFMASLSPEQKAALEEYIAQMQGKAADTKPPEEETPAQKAADPAPSEEVQKRDAEIADLRKRLADETDKRLSREYAEKAGVYDAIPGDRAVLAKMLRAIDEKAPELAADFGSLLSAVNEVAKRGEAILFQPVGKSTTTPASPMARLQAIAADIMKSNPKLSEPAAMAEAQFKNPDLYAAARAERQ